jgi:hypothetical protein
MTYAVLLSVHMSRWPDSGGPKIRKSITEIGSLCRLPLLTARARNRQLIIQSMRRYI